MYVGSSTEHKKCIIFCFFWKKNLSFRLACCLLRLDRVKQPHELFWSDVAAHLFFPLLFLSLAPLAHILHYD